MFLIEHAKPVSKNAKLRASLTSLCSSKEMKLGGEGSFRGIQRVKGFLWSNSDDMASRGNKLCRIWRDGICWRVRSSSVPSCMVGQSLSPKRVAIGVHLDTLL